MGFWFWLHVITSILIVALLSVFAFVIFMNYIGIPILTFLLDLHGK